MKAKSILDIGKIIHNRRKEYNLTLAELGSLIGLKKAYLSLVENGKTRITYRDACRVCHALDLDMETLKPIYGYDKNFVRELKGIHKKSLKLRDKKSVKFLVKKSV